MRRTRRYRTPSVHLGGRYLVRLLALGGLAVVAMVTLGWQAKIAIGGRGAPKPAERRGAVRTAIVPSPFAELGAGVLVTAWAPADRPSEAPPKAKQPAPHDDPFGIDHELLQGLMDKTRGLPPKAYYHLVGIADKTAPDVLERSAKSEREVTFAHLWTEPDNHRGQPILLKGHLRGLVRFDAVADKSLNPTGLTSLYQGDLFTQAAHPHPYILIVPDVPEGMPLGMDILEDVTFAGFFFKLWRYQAGGDVERAAPLLIGRITSWTPAAQQKPESRLGNWLAIVLVVLAAGIVAATWALNRGMRGSRYSGAAAQGESNPEVVKADLARLEGIELPDPIKSLEEQHP